MKIGSLIRRNMKTRGDALLFREDENEKDAWLAVVLKYTPLCEYNHYIVIEALVTPENTVMKTYLTKEELETLIEVVC